MKKTIATKIVNLVLLISIIMSLPISALAQDEIVIPDSPASLASIDFKNATLDQEFSSNKVNYTITLDDPNIAPTLESYEINGDADIFITYDLDETGKQTGIKATLKFSNISIEYKFVYSNPPQMQINSNNNLAYVSSNLCEVYPELNDKDTSYTIYIPSDLTQIELSVATQDPNARVTVPGSITLDNSKERALPAITVIASDASKKTYNFKVKRIDRTMEEIKANPDSQSFIRDQIAHEKREIFIIIGAALLGLLALAVFISLAKKLTVKVYDEDDIEFLEIEKVKESKQTKKKGKKHNDVNKLQNTNKDNQVSKEKSKKKSANIKADNKSKKDKAQKSKSNSKNNNTNKSNNSNKSKNKSQKGKGQKK